jgi:hypothetical protein
MCIGCVLAQPEMEKRPAQLNIGSMSLPGYPPGVSHV